MNHAPRLVACLQSFPSGPSGSVAEFVVKYGRAFAPPSGPLPQGRRYRRTRKKSHGNCYGNALSLMRERPELTYVEGYGLAFGNVPVRHAWCIDGSDAVIDVSWNPARVGQSEYLGVPLARTWVARCVAQSGRAGFLDPGCEW